MIWQHMFHQNLIKIHRVGFGVGIVGFGFPAVGLGISVREDTRAEIGETVGAARGGRGKREGGDGARTDGRDGI